MVQTEIFNNILVDNILHDRLEIDAEEKNKNKNKKEKKEEKIK